MSWNLNIWGGFDESGTDGAEYSRKVTSGRRMVGDFRSLVNARDLELECVRVLPETLLYLFLRMAVRQCYGRRRRDLGLGLYIWTTSDIFLELGGWIESRIYG